MYKFEIIVDLKKQGKFPTFKKAFKAWHKKITEFLLQPPHGKEICWIKNLSNNVVISFAEAMKIAIKLELIPERRNKIRI